MKIALLTQYVPTPQEDYTQLFNLTGPNRDEWCQRHGYEHIVQRGHYKDPASYYAFDRLKLLRDLLDRPGAADIFWVLNVQALITNITKPLTEVIDNQHDAFLMKDVHGLNCGSMIYRNSRWTREWLDFIISQEPRYRNEPWREQKAMMDHWLHERWTYKICLLPHYAIGSYLYDLYKPWVPAETPGNWQKGDLCLALPGLNLQQRLDIVRKVLGSDMVVR